MKVDISGKAILLTLLFLVMAAALVTLGLKVNAQDCQVQMQQSYAGGVSDALTQLVDGVKTKGIVIIGMPNNQSFQLTNPAYCEAILKQQQQ